MKLIDCLATWQHGGKSPITVYQFVDLWR